MAPNQGRNHGSLLNLAPAIAIGNTRRDRLSHRATTELPNAQAAAGSGRCRRATLRLGDSVVRVT